MTDETDKATLSAEQAYAAATQELPVTEAAQPAAQAEAPVPAAAPRLAEKPGKGAPKAKADPSGPRKASAAKATVPAPKPRPAAKPAGRKKTTRIPEPQVTQLKETKMAKTTDFTAPMTETLAEMQDKAKAAYEKSTAVASEMTEFSKGNVEALVESGKILSSAMQDMTKSAVEEAKSAFETMTADMKEMAAVKSPTDLFQLQSKLMRRNFDSMVAYSSKASENMLKLANDAMAPLSSRMSTAAEMVSKVA